MKKILFFVLLFISFFILFLFVYFKENDKTIYYSFDNEVNYVTLNNLNIVLKVNDVYDLKNKKIVDIIKNKNIIKIENNLITALELGTCVIKVKDNSIIKRINIKVVPKENIIKFKNNFVPIFGPIDNNNYSMQNFEIENNNTFISFVNTSYIKTDKYNCKNNKQIHNQINKVYVKKYKNNKLMGTLTLKDSGHGQSFLVDDNYIWTTSEGQGYFDNFNRCWGKGKELVKIKWKNKTFDTKSSNLKIKLYNNKGGTYTNPVVSFDKENKLASINVGRTVMVWDLNRFKNKKLDKKLYQFKIANNIERILNENKIYKQGNVLYGGYYYILYGAINENNYIVVYDMFGEIKKIVKYNLKNLGFEAEGIKIYNKKLYIGIQKGNKRSYIYELR